MNETSREVQSYPMPVARVQLFGAHVLGGPILGGQFARESGFLKKMVFFATAKDFFFVAPLSTVSDLRDFGHMWALWRGGRYKGLCRSLAPPAWRGKKKRRRRILFERWRNARAETHDSNRSTVMGGTVMMGAVMRAVAARVEGSGARAA